MNINMRTGLTTKEAEERLEKYGKNEIKRTVKLSPLKIFITQFTSPLILILIGAAIISLIVGNLPGQESNISDAVLILAIVLFSGISGFFQEYKAEKSIEALQKMSAPKSKVIRDGKEKIMPASEIVPGDIVLLDSGDLIPADAKILECSNLKVDESIITGESRDVEKKKNDIVLMNTFVTVGRAKVVVIETGMDTRIGKIADKLQKMKEDKTSFQIELSQLSKKIFWMIIVLIVLMASVGLFKYGIYMALMISISLAVAAIPEGLPAIVTLSLAFGAKIMSKRNALVRKLSVIESTGSIDVICTDKTGTLTEDNSDYRTVNKSHTWIDLPQKSCY